MASIGKCDICGGPLTLGRCLRCENQSKYRFVNREFVILAVLVGVIVLKEFLFRKVSTVGADVESIAVKADAWHHRSDAITSLAAFIGISISLIGGSDYESADDYAALFASFIIAFNAFKLVKPAVGELMDEAPSNGIEKEVHKIALCVPGVMALDKCFVRKVGFDYYVDLHAVVNGSITVSRGHKISHAIKHALTESNLRIVNVLVHIEPFLKKRSK